MPAYSFSHCFRFTYHPASPGRKPQKVPDGPSSHPIPSSSTTAGGLRVMSESLTSPVPGLGWPRRRGAEPGNAIVPKHPSCETNSQSYHEYLLHHREPVALNPLIYKENSHITQIRKALSCIALRKRKCCESHELHHIHTPPPEVYFPSCGQRKSCAMICPIYAFRQTLERATHRPFRPHRGHLPRCGAGADARHGRYTSVHISTHQYTFVYIDTHVCAPTCVRTAHADTAHIHQSHQIN